MKLRPLAAPILLVLVSAFCLTPPSASRSEAYEQRASAKPCPPLSLDEAEISVAPPAPKNAREKALREARSLRYAGPAAALDPPLEDTACGVVMAFARPIPQPLLPTSLSDAVIVGRVSSLQAYLTSERTLLYTEFKVVIDEVVKRPRDTPLAPGQSILVERLGGAIRLPSGKLVAVRPQNLGPLIVGHKYLLFLKRNSEDDYSILGAYDFTKRPIEPLDTATPQLPSELAKEKARLLSRVRNTRRMGQSTLEMCVSMVTRGAPSLNLRPLAGAFRYPPGGTASGESEARCLSANRRWTPR